MDLITTPTTAPMNLKGTKFDTDKVRWDLLPGDALEEIAIILSFGAKKYGDRNWEQGMKWSRVFGALMRHSWAWFRGQNLDPETGRSHLAHAGCCVLFLLAYHLRNTPGDDRPRGEWNHLTP